MTNLQDTLKVRKNVHGNFCESAVTHDKLMDVVWNTPNWSHMDAAKRRSIHMICEKLSRILWGDYNFADHWHDIAGYATLIDQQLTIHTEDSK